MTWDKELAYLSSSWTTRCKYEIHREVKVARWKNLGQVCVRLPDVLERQVLSLNFLSKRVMSLILEKHLVVPEKFSGVLENS